MNVVLRKPAISRLERACMMHLLANAGKHLGLILETRQTDEFRMTAVFEPSLQKTFVGRLTAHECRA